MRARETGHVRGRRLALVAGSVVVAFAGAFAVGASTRNTRVAQARLAPAVGSAQPAALNLVVSRSGSVPTLVGVPTVKPKPKPKLKPATVASAPVSVAPVVAPVLPSVAAVVVRPVVRTPVTAPPARPTGSGSTGGGKSTSGSGTVSGSG